MPSRRSHNKSKHGCLQCKQRRIKCDERRPACQNCSSRGCNCEYQSVAPLVWKNDVGGESALSSTSSSSHEPSPELLSSNLNSHMELMVQWFTNTYKSLSRNRVRDEIWHSVIPQEALKYPFLMHAVLALSALHISCTTTGDCRNTNLKTAQIYQTCAIKGLTQTVHYLDKSNCHATYAVSNILTIYTIAFPLALNSLRPETILDDICQVFRVMQGSMTVLEEVLDWVKTGVLGPLIQEEFSQHTSTSEEFKHIQHFLQELNQTRNSQSSQHVRSIYDTVICFLASCLENCVRSGNSAASVLVWIFQLPDDFLTFVQERQPMALVILAYYSVAMHWLRDFWWMDRWGQTLLRGVAKQLHDDWRPSIAWAIAKIETANI